MTQRNRANTQSKRASGPTLTQEDDESFSLPSTSQVQRAMENFTPAQVDQKAAEVVQFFLVKDQKKIPIRRADLVKHVVKEYRNVYTEIIKRAARTLDQVFGLQMVEIDSKNHIYILVNKLEASEGASPISSPTNPKMGLLFVILSIVFMKGGSVREQVIWNTLKKLRVDAGVKHDEFGDVRKVVTDEFVRQRAAGGWINPDHYAEWLDQQTPNTCRPLYLEYVRIPHTEPVEHEFRWGQRAETEVSKAKILEVLGEIHDKEPQSWSQQYKEAHGTASQAGASSQR